MMKTLLCVLKNGLAVYKGDMVYDFESPAERIEIRTEGDSPVETNTHLVFENGDHVMVACSNPDISDQHLIDLIEKW
jgi:hypothetical protein